MDVLDEDHKGHNITAGDIFVHMGVFKENNPDDEDDTADDEAGNKDFAK